MNKNFQLVLIAFLSGAFTLLGYKLFFEKNEVIANPIVSSSSPQLKPVGLSSDILDFTDAAEKTVNHVVHVENKSYRTVYNPLDFFYGNSGGRQIPQVGTGSGVIISEDGFVVTNYHVIKDAKEIKVTLNNNNSYQAELVGSDPKMDIALLKLNTKDRFSYAVFADSDEVKVGEWVLAVGNPFNLNSTVTAGIVSAKARNLSQGGLQSFIQTDAAVNPGNSGGALVNTRGELIGINTMISSNTGSYVGYAFAVPSNVTRKIIEDILEFGNVQRGILGVEGVELNNKTAEEFGTNIKQGFMVRGINKNSGAEKAGIKVGDIITQIDNRRINSFSDLTEIISTRRPNEVVKVHLIRDNKNMTLDVKLMNKDLLRVEFNGFEFEEIDTTEKQRFKIKEGVKIKSINNERYQQHANKLTGSIVLSIDGNKVSSMTDASRILSTKSDNETVELEIINPQGNKYQLML